MRLITKKRAYICIDTDLTYKMSYNIVRCFNFDPKVLPYFSHFPRTHIKFGENRTMFHCREIIIMSSDCYLYERMRVFT